MTKDHVPLLVFGVFNANIPKNEKSSELTVGTEVAFKVIGMDVRSLPIMINGKLLTEKQLRKKVEKRLRQDSTEQDPEKNDENSNSDEGHHKTNNEPAPAAEEAGEPSKKRRKNKAQ